jgi:uncharacterized protein
MIDDDIFVVDATVHGFNFDLGNARTEQMRQLRAGAWRNGLGFTPHPKYDMTEREFYEQFRYQPDVMLQIMFAESRTDVIVYHGVPLEGLYHDGSSPLWVGLRAAERFPHRVFNYAPVYPSAPDALDRIDEAATHSSVIGIKTYPADLREGTFLPELMDNDRAFEVVQRCQHHGIKMIGLHKAVPIGPFAEVRDWFGVSDLPPAIEAFPDMTFEIVHGGFAYLPETLDLLDRYPNVVINLEGVQTMMRQAPERWAELMNVFTTTEDRWRRIFWSVASTAFHPEGWIEEFMAWQQPDGMAPLTREMKAAMLGGNYARWMGWDVAAMKASCAADEFGLRSRSDELTEPWSWLRSQMPPDPELDLPDLLGPTAASVR